MCFFTITADFHPPHPLKCLKMLHYVGKWFTHIVNWLLEKKTNLNEEFGSFFCFFV